jgi:hypothetical protein
MNAGGGSLVSIVVSTFNDDGSIDDSPARLVRVLPG